MALPLSMAITRSDVQYELRNVSESANATEAEQPGP